MTDAEMIASVDAIVDDARLTRFTRYYLQVAKSAVVAHLFPFEESADWTDVPDKHHGRVVEMTVYLVNRRGAEGQLAHSENGVYRTYEDAAIPPSYFRGMVPHVGVPA